MDAPEIEKLKALALAPAERVEACIADVMARFPTDSKDYYVEVHQHLAPLARQLERQNDALIAEVERLRGDAERYQWIRDVENSDDAWNMIGSGLDDTKLDTAIDAAIEKEKA